MRSRSAPSALEVSEGEIALWENRVVDPMDRRPLSLDQMRGITSYVWSHFGLSHPPLTLGVADDDPWRNVGLAYASHTATVAVGEVTTVTMLHELAHHLTDDPVAAMELRQPIEKATHGDVWLGNYVHLLDLLMGPRFNKGYIMSTLPKGRAPKWYPIVHGVARVPRL